MVQALNINETGLPDFCRRNHIQRLAIFGSVSKGTVNVDSDLDVLVDYEPGHTHSLRFFEIEEELSELLGRRVDLNTKGFLIRYFLDQVEKDRGSVCRKRGGDAGAIAIVKCQQSVRLAGS